MHIGVLCDSYLLCAMFCVTSTFMLSVKRFVIPQNKKGKCESRFIFVLFLCIFNFDFDEVKKNRAHEFHWNSDVGKKAYGVRFVFIQVVNRINCHRKDIEILIHNLWSLNSIAIKLNSMTKFGFVFDVLHWEALQTTW